MAGSEIQTPQFYEPEEVQQILKIALTNNQEQQLEELSREQLCEIAEELNISRERLAAAEKNWLEQKITQNKRQAFDIYRQEQLKQTGIKYAIFNIFFLSLNWLISGNLSWSLYLLLFCSLWLALKAWKTYQSQGEEYENAFRSWERRHELKQMFGNIWDSIRKAWQT